MSLSHSWPRQAPLRPLRPVARLRNMLLISSTLVSACMPIEDARQLRQSLGTALSYTESNHSRLVYPRSACIREQAYVDDCNKTWLGGSYCRPKAAGPAVTRCVDVY